jgi:hypothetical protein
MKTLTALYFFSLLLCFNGHSQSTECLKNIKTGKFEYTAPDGIVTVIRTKKKQIELIDNGNAKLINKIKWISDNEYILTFVKAINSPGCLEKGDTMRMTITDCDKYVYTVYATSENCGSAQLKISIVEGANQ